MEVVHCDYYYTVVSGDSSGHICTWQMRKNEYCEVRGLTLMRRWQAHEGGVLSLSAIRCVDSMMIGTGGDDGSIGVHRVGDEGEEVEIESTTRIVSGAAVTGVQVLTMRNGDVAMMCVGNDQCVRWYGIETGRCVVMNSSKWKMWIDVVDASDMATVRTRRMGQMQDEVMLVICGQGLQSVVVAGG